MILRTPKRPNHFNPRRWRLKPIFGVLAAGSVANALLAGPDPPLRAQLGPLVAAGRVEDAIRVAQDAFRAAPGIRAEFVSQRLALANTWIGQDRFDDALAADPAPSENVRRCAPAVRRVLERRSPGYAPDGWRGFGWSSAAELQRDWLAWRSARRPAPRAPRMLLAPADAPAPAP